MKRLLISTLLILVCSSTFAQDQSSAPVPSILGPHYFALYVSDFEESSQWYRSIFELTVHAPSQAEDGSWRIENLMNPSLHIELIYDSRAEEIDRAIGFRKVGFSVPDVDIVADNLEELLGARPQVVMFEPLNQRILQVRDPDGNILQLSSPLTR